jgi:hypothetical protein
VETKDGVEFKPGMTLVTDSGDELETNERDFIILPFEGTIGRGGMHTAVNRFYSSQAARLSYYKESLEKAQKEIQKDIDIIKDVLEVGNSADMSRYQRDDFLYLS